MPMTNHPSLDQLAQNPSCMDDYDPNAMSVEQARVFIQQFLMPVAEVESVPVMQSLARVLAKTINSPCNVPNHNNSAMDGFAFKIQDASKQLRIIGTALAGKPFAGQLNQGECIKIMTGAVIPQGADTVVMQEHTESDGQWMTIKTSPAQGANIRPAGDDLKIGQVVLLQGHLMQAADLGLIASLGIAEVAVYRKVKVAFFSTGDELSSVGTPLKEGQIYDSNRYTIYGMLSRLGVSITDLGVVPDDINLLESTLLNAANQHDAVLTSGGVSVGEADHMKTLLAKHGQVLFWKINMKPGRPLAYGKIGNAHYFGLPGNPVATMVTFYQFVRNALLQIMGAQPKTLPTFKVVCAQPIKKVIGRVEFQRGLLFEEEGTWKVKPLGNQSSGVLSSMSFANCFIVLAETISHCEKDQLVDVQPFEGLI
jgi:molybdopterin molybdotransferase